MVTRLFCPKLWRRSHLRDSPIDRAAADTKLKAVLFRGAPHPGSEERAFYAQWGYKKEAMQAFIALLRAVNVGGTGKLPMSELKAMCEAAGFKSVKTYIASGNVVFKSGKSEAEVKATLEAALAAYAGKPVGVMVRTAPEMAAVLSANPFHGVPGNRTVAIFLDAPPPRDTLGKVAGQVREELALGRREIYGYYPDGQGESKLTIPAAKNGTARNMNTVAKLAQMAQGL
jgi:uncharacterized protein (DUF1697 family)